MTTYQELMVMQNMLIWALASLALPLLAAAQPTPPVEELAQRGKQAGIEAELLQVVWQRAAQQGLPESQVAGLLQPAVELAEQGLPSRQVLRKALEGLSKQVPSSRVASVLNRMQQHTGQAGKLVDPWLRRPEVARLVSEGRASPEQARARGLLVENLAQTLMQDVPEETIKTLLDALPAQLKRERVPAAELGTAFGILADLPTARSEPGATAQLITSALNAGFSQDELRRLPAAVQAAQQQGQVPAEAVVREAANRMRQGSPASDVLNSLFRGGHPGTPPAQAGPPPGVGPPDEKGPPVDTPNGAGGPPDDKGPPGGSRGRPPR